MAVFGRAALAEEVITSFHQDIVLDQDGSMAVTETIKVNSEGRDIRHGIFRDFPLTFVDSAGRTATVDFKLQSIERDGAADQWRTERISGGTRIYIGSADVLLNPGPHVFQLTYRTDRQIRYFSDYDELYWNVTGNGWLFRILDASATVTLPSGVKQEGIAYSTGPLGAKGRDARVTETGSAIAFETTRPLGQGEGLTINVKLPKGAIAPPSAAQEKLWFFRDNLDLIIAFGGLVLVLAYYARAWFAVGRDPARGVMVPRWDAPDGISPALVNYIDNRGFSGAGWTALSATALDLAVKGYVVLKDLEQKIVISPTKKAPFAKFEGGEKALMESLSPYAPLIIDKANGEKVQKVGQKFRSAIESEHRGEYYKSNALYTVGGVLLSVAFLAAIVIFGRLHENALPLIIVPAFLSIFFTVIAVSLGKGFRRNASIASRILAVVVFGFIGFVAVSIVAGVVAAMASSTETSAELPLMVAIIGIFVTNLVFFFLMGAPTAIGTRMMDGIDGLRQYLTLAEKDRMNMQGAPSMSPQHFETLLPYAVALGVEKPWSRTFETWLAAAAAGAAVGAYAPGWYIGAYNGNFSDRIGGFSSSMASTIASTIPAPVSSSSSGFSGGGSSSGGGGGGGGGGGW
ncbi:hypothetical protein CPY51_30955 [Rhizobium tubonense]|uniref:DUF2207 domain-containing protein n=2 Tax=Rhizobium tubonense TaxID=484088 RepID=A0A2W4DUR4_9HYPH|nr:DUF2207 domain-containing protein [Rhizobium tubonense]PZM07786.1 hypothetical protein CPY51_30955 [Rhizobium tubonense]